MITTDPCAPVRVTPVPELPVNVKVVPLVLVTWSELSLMLVITPEVKVMSLTVVPDGTPVSVTVMPTAMVPDSADRPEMVVYPELDVEVAVAVLSPFLCVYVSPTVGVLSVVFSKIKFGLLAKKVARVCPVLSLTIVVNVLVDVSQ